MQNAFSPLVAMYQTQLEASRRFADAVFSGTEKIDRAMIGATHRVFNEQLKLVETMATVRDPRNIGAALQSGAMSRNPDEATNYQQEIMRIYAEMQNDIGRSMQEYIEQLGAHASASATRPLEIAQEKANDTMFNPVTSMFSVWESAFKEVAALAKKNMTTARSAVEQATGKAIESAAGYATAAADAATAAASSQAEAGKHSIIVDTDTPTDHKRNAAPGSGKRK